MTTIGIDPTRVSAVAEFKLGTKVSREDSDGTKEYVYVRADGAITGDGYVCVIDSADGDAAHVSTTNSAPGSLGGAQVGVARAAFADNDYGFLQVYGAGDIRVAASCAKGTILNSTATAGQLDDDGTAGAEEIEGIVLNTANGAAAGTATGFINYPRVGNTLA